MNQSNQPRTLRGWRPAVPGESLRGRGLADDSGDRNPLSIDPTLLQLPSGYTSMGDPVESNPFTPGSVRHQLWADATRRAEEQIARLKSEFIIAQKAISRRVPQTIEEMEQFNIDSQELSRRLIAAEFQVWAARGAQAVLTDGDVLMMDRWLVDFANGWLDVRAQHMLRHRMPGHLIEAELRWMRDHLAALVLHWKAEIRRGRAIREDEARQLREGHSAADVPDAARSSLSATFPNRARWLRVALEARGWTVRDFERRGGPEARTTRKVLRGEDVRETVLEKIAQALSNKSRVTLTDIPRN